MRRLAYRSFALWTFSAFREKLHVLTTLGKVRVALVNLNTTAPPPGERRVSCTTIVMTVLVLMQASEYETNHISPASLTHGRTKPPS